MKEEDILAQALCCLREIMPQLPIDYFQEKGPKEVDDSIINIGGHQFRAFIRGNITLASLNYLLDQIRTLPPSSTNNTILISSYIYPKLAAKLAENGIASLDCSGNCFISDTPLFISISGKKKSVDYEDNVPFVDSELKLIFYLLTSDKNLQKPYRTMGQETGLSLGTISNCMNKLVKDVFLVKTTEKRFFPDKKSLIDQWQLSFNQSMKRKQFIQSFSFINAEARRKWGEMILPKGMYWGGESGAYILDGYLKPERFTIYSDIASSTLLKTGLVIPAEKGEIRVYRKFWNDNDTQITAPRLLIYADLMGTGDSRCLDAANRIMGYEN